MTRRPEFILAGLTAALLFAGADPASAQMLSDKYWGEASLYWPTVDSGARVESTRNDQIGTEIDFESDLDLANDKALPAFLVGARLGGGFSVIGEYYALNRSASARLERDITFEDVVYPASVEVMSGFDSDIYRLAIGYAFVREDNFELGAALGLHATGFELSISGEAEVNGVSGQTSVRRKEFVAPLPTLGLFGTFEIAPRLTLGGRVDYLSLKIDDYDGRLLNAQANLVYRFTDNFGIGAGYRHVDYRVDVEKERWTGRFEYEFSGPTVFLQAGF